MPPTKEGNSQPIKRKRPAASSKPLKRARSESSDEDVQEQILILENDIHESKKNYNNIVKLVSKLRDPEEAVIAAISLCRVFTRLMVSGDMAKKKDTTEKDAVVIGWLRERYKDYKSGLVALLAEEEIASTVLTVCMRILETEGRYLRNSSEYTFPEGFLTDIVRVLVEPGNDERTRLDFSQKFVEEYDDVRYYTLEALEKILRNAKNRPEHNQIFDNALQVLQAIESVPESKEELEDFYIPAPKKSTHALYSLSKHKARAQGAWLALMNLQMEKDQRKAILTTMATSIAPWFVKPEMLMDFLTDSYDAGGSTSLLALSGVFYLIQEKNLDYPSFYKKLYSLLDSEILHSKHRSRFFRLLDTFLASTHLPAVLVASFLKRLSRLTLNSSPAGVVAVVPWIYNILKKHPTCTFMIHREIRDPSMKEMIEIEGLDDPFNMDEDDPMETDAIESSLWEIVMLQSHFHPNVATLAKIISEQFTKSSYNIEDFLDHSYGSMLEAELEKELKKTPVIEYVIPKRIFMKQDAGSEFEDTLLVKLWAFS